MAIRQINHRYIDKENNNSAPKDRRKTKRSSRIMNSYMDIYIDDVRVRVEEDYEDMSIFAVDRIEEVLKENSKAVLGLPTGGTPVRMYEILVERYKEGRLDFSEATVFCLDEYHPISPTHTKSFTYFMYDHFLKHVNLPKDRFFIPNGETTDIKEECIRYDRALQRAGGIDLQIVGVGRNGHIAFNEPSDHFTKKTHHIELTPSTKKANGRFFKSIEDVPEYAISMSVQSVFGAKEILLIASGEEKSDIVLEMLTGSVKPTVPASILQIHPNTIVALDKKAGRKLVEELVESV